MNYAFTTHTPIEADMTPTMSCQSSTETVDLSVPKQWWQRKLNMTLLALNLSTYVNGVAKRHQEISSKMFTGYEIHAITNGVHSHTWTGEVYRKLFDKYLPSWIIEPELLAKVDLIPDGEIWQAHQQQKQILINYIKDVTNIQLDPEVFINRVCTQSY